MEVTIPYWNKVWKTLALGGNKLPKELLVGLLNEVGDDLCKGIKVYDTPFNKTECENWLKQSELQEMDQSFQKYFIRLCKALDLQAQSCWSVLCNYLLYEFHGKLSQIKYMTLYEPYATKLVEKIWHFYTSERMFVLKALRFILENYHNNDYSDILANYMKRVTWPFLWGSVIGQMETLIAEINVNNSSNTIDKAIWVERNYQEQLEVALIAICAIEFSNFTVDDFIPLFRVYMKNDFGRTPETREAKEFDQLHCAEIAAFLVFVDNCWSNHSYWLNKKKELDELVNSATNCRGHDLVMFGWVMLQANLRANDCNEYITYYSKKFDTLYYGGVLKKFKDLTFNVRRFKCKPGKSMMKALYSLMDQLNTTFNEDGFISLNPDACEVLYELLRDENICFRYLFSTTSTLITDFIKYAWWFFPYDFKSATMLMSALTEQGYGGTVVNELNGLKTYAEEYMGVLKEDSNMVVHEDCYPIANSTLMRIPAQTKITVYSKFKKTLVLYHTNYTYPNLIVALMDALLTKLSENDGYEVEDVEKVFLGVKLLAMLIQNNLLDVKDMGTFLRKLNRLCLLFNRRSYNFALIDCFLQTVEGALFSNIDEKMVFWPADFLPKLDKTTNEFLPSKLVGMIEAEEQEIHHAVLITYMSLVARAYCKDVFRTEIQLPGFVFLVKHIFPRLKIYKYAEIGHYYKISNLIMGLVWDVIKQDRNNPKDPFLFNFCMDTFLKDSSVLKGYRELFKTTLHVAQKSLEKESCWEGYEQLPINEFLRLTLQTLLAFIKHNTYRKAHKQAEDLRFDQIILCAPLDRLNIVKYITAFVGYSYDSHIQDLALQILQKLAVNQFYPIFGPMDIEPAQLQMFFLDKLRDPLENDIIKMEIITFILTCVEHQPGLTDAFFNVSVMRDDEEEDGESVINCMVEFLGSVEESKVTVQHPLLCGVLAVIHKVWDVGGTHLIEHVKNLNNFWSTLTKPLYQDIAHDPNFYGCIFGILGKELLYSKNNVSSDFLQVVRDLLDVKKGFMQRWSEYLVKVTSKIKNSKIIDEFEIVTYGGDIFMIYAWKLFINNAMMFASDLFHDYKLRKIITVTCLDAILAQFQTMGELVCIKFWTELYDITMHEWSAESFTPIVPQLFTKTQQVLTAMTNNFNGVEASAKVAILTATSNLLSNFADYCEENYQIILEILAPLTVFVEYEFTQFGAEINEAYNRETDNMPNAVKTWMLIQSLVNRILSMESVEKYASWFTASDFIKKTLWCIGPLLKSPKTLSFVKYPLKTLLLYMETPFSKGILSIDMRTFYEETAPPMECFRPPSGNTELIREWWLIYAEIIDFINGLITEYGDTVCEEMFAFLYFHDETVIAGLELIKTTADTCALNLVCSLLRFCNNFLFWKRRWIMYKHNYYFRTVQCIKDCISGVANLILRPQHLYFVRADTPTRIVPDEEISENTYQDIYNMALEALTLGIQFFASFFHHLIESFDGEPNKPFVFELEKDFYIPKYNLSELNIFTYGGILCLLHCLFKAYAKIKERIARVTEENTCTRETLQTTPTVKKKTTNNQPYFPLIISQTDVELIQDPYAPLHKFTSINFNIFNMAWFHKLDFRTVVATVELLTFFVVLELAWDLCALEMTDQEKQYMRRELGSEMQFFADCVRRSQQGRLATVTTRYSPRDQLRLHRLADYMDKLLSQKKMGYHDEFLWALNHVVNIHCRAEDDDDN